MTGEGNKVFRVQWKRRPGINSDRKNNSIQVSTSMCLGSAFIASRIARHLKVKLLDEHATRDELFEIRQKYLDALTKQGNGNLSDPKVFVQAYSNEELDGDAPEGHAAWTRCYYSEKKGTATVSLPPPSKLYFQVTAKACNFSEFDCLRVARLCYMRLTDGASKEEVTAFRNECYRRCVTGGQEPETQKRKHDDVDQVAPDEKRQKIENRPPDRPIDEHTADVNKLHAEGRLAGSIIVSGRGLEKKNPSINGIYVPLAEAYRDTVAYESYPTAEGAKKKFIFYSDKKANWRINDELGVDKGGFATLVAESIMPLPADINKNEASQGWSIFDGKQEGWNVDAAVRCTWLQPFDGQEEDEKEVKEENDENVKKEITYEEDDQVVSSSSGSSSGSDSSASEAEDEKKVALAVKASPWQNLHLKKKVCGKMLVHCGIRCMCHFAPKIDCPGGGGWEPIDGW